MSCAPATFSRKMAELLIPLLREGWVKNYLDDVIIWAEDFYQLLEKLKKLFDLFEEKGVKLNLTKCDFVKKEIKFLSQSFTKGKYA